MITIDCGDNLTIRILQKKIQVWRGAVLITKEMNPIDAITMLRRIDRNTTDELKGKVSVSMFKVALICVKDKIAKYFEGMRFDDKHHLGCGDIRLTIGQQEEILSYFDGMENGK